MKYSVERGDLMPAVTVSLSQEYIKKIERGQKKLGISKSELIRRALDEYLAKMGLLDG